MALDWRKLLGGEPESIESDRVALKEKPFAELGLTLGYILIAGIWFVFSADVFDFVMGDQVDSPALHSLKGINFVTTSGLLLYVVLRRSYRRRRQAEEASRLSQERFEAVALAATDAIWDMNFDTKVIWWSDGVRQVFGYPPEEVSSKVEWWLERLHPEDRDRVATAIKQVVDSGGRTWSGHYRFRRRDGSYAMLLDRGYVLHDARGKPVRVVGGVSDVTEKRRAEEALENSRRQLRALSARLHAAREEERTHVAREIHDQLGQLLTALKINLDWLEGKLSQGEGDATLNAMLDRVVECGEIADSSIESVQRIATELRPRVLDNLGLVAALEQELRQFRQRTGITCDFRYPEEPLELGKETATAIFRIAQEALTNVVRHAQATAVTILLEADQQEVRLQVDDNGCGIKPGAVWNPKSIGLIGMRERAAVLGGEVTISGLATGGTHVSLRLPRTADDSRFWAEL